MDIKRTYISLLIAPLTAMLCASCSDDLFDGTGITSLDDGIAFSISTREQEDIVAGTRAAANALETKVTALQGSASGLYVHTLPYPAVGYHDASSKHGGSAAGETRAAVADIATTANFYDSLAVYGYTDNGTTLFQGSVLTKANNWRSTVRWPFDASGATSMRFYAIAPAKASGLTSSSESPTYSSAPSFTYTVPGNIHNQPDLLYGTSGDVAISSKNETTDKGKDNKLVSLTFQHILTAVRFAQGKIPSGFKITGLSISGIKNKATFTAGTDASTAAGTWSTPTGSASYDVIKQNAGTYVRGKEFTSKAYAYAPTANTYIDGDSALFLMPQTLSGAQIAVTFQVPDDNATTYTTRTVSANISGTWQQGCTYTYLITIGTLVDDYVLITDGLQEYSHNTEAQNKSFTVTSYRNTRTYTSDTEKTNNATGEDETAAKALPVKWKFDGYYTSTDGKTFTQITDNTSTEWPYWLSATSDTTDWTGGSEQDGGYRRKGYYTIDPQKYYSTEAKAYVNASHIKNLKDNGTATTVIDLSKARGYQSTGNARETANCYIVNQAGTYIFPLVYGNAITNGSEQKGTVLKDQKESYGIVDHTGYNIIRAWINDHFSESGNNNTLNAKLKAAAKAGSTYYQYSFPTTESSDYVKILWQDQKDLIDDANDTNKPKLIVKTEDGKTRHYAQFTIQNTNIQPGNALIGVYADKTAYTYVDGTNDTKGTTTKELVWTWHIWVTDEVYPNAAGTYDYHENESNGTEVATLTNASNAKNDIMTVNLGWVPEEDTYGRFVHRDIYVKIKQVDDGRTGFGKTPKEAYVHIVQKAKQDLIKGWSTFYQWGRPTAMPMEQKLSEKMTGYDNNDTLVKGDSQFITLYDNTGSTIETKIVRSDNVQDAILLAPNMLRYKGNNDNDWWDTSKLYNFWGGNSDGTATTKTLYDPCPPGFKVPYTSVFTGLTSDGKDKTTGDNNASASSNIIYAIDGQDRHGVYYYTTHPTGGTNYTDPYVYMPSTGHWSANQPVNTLMKYQNKAPGKGDYWLSKYDGSTKKGYMLYITPSSIPENNEVYFNNTEDFHDGLPIRPMKE